MQIVINVIESKGCFGFEVQIDGGRIESHASIGSWHKEAFESMCHLTAVTVHGKMLALTEAAEQIFAPDPETGGAKSDEESTPAVSGR